MISFTLSLASQNVFLLPISIDLVTQRHMIIQNPHLTGSLNLEPANKCGSMNPGVCLNFLIDI